MNAVTSPIVGQFENRKEESSGECPSPDDSFAGICVSDNCVEPCSGPSDVIFGRHGPRVSTYYFGREHAPRRAVTRRKNFHQLRDAYINDSRILLVYLKASPAPEPSKNGVTVSRGARGKARLTPPPDLYSVKFC